VVAGFLLTGFGLNWLYNFHFDKPSPYLLFIAPHLYNEASEKINDI